MRRTPLGGWASLWRAATMQGGASARTGPRRASRLPTAPGEGQDGILPGGLPVPLSWTRLPFRYDTPADYARQLSAWLGRVFYEALPAAGYQVREEQAYFAFRVAAALADGRPLLAEAGSGTGKTFAYLLPAICHARLRGRPVVVATATPALQSQLAGAHGDIATLSRLLDLEVDARVARRPQDVVCDIRVERYAGRGRRAAGRKRLLRWAEGSREGARAEFPEAPDALWREVAWDSGCRCDICPRRGYCRLMRGRAQARAALDLLVVSHELFFQDTFSRDRLPPGSLPVLPPFSAVIFDEGHRVAAEAQRAAGFHLKVDALLQAVDGCEGQGVRIRLLSLAETARRATRGFAARLAAARAPDDGGERRVAVARAPELLESAARLERVFARLQDEMTIEEGLHEETAYGDRLASLHHRFDEARAALRALAAPDQIPFCEEGAFWVVPGNLGPLWRRHLPPGAPLVFSSATLSAAGSFAYSAEALGLERPLTAAVGVPFRLAEQMLCYVPTDLPPPEHPDFWPRVARRIADVLRRSRGRALLLLPAAAAQDRLRAELRTGYTVRWEGDAGPEALLAAFARDRDSCLAGHSFWEGIDVPGETLSAVIVPLLPLPGRDPLLEARRAEVAARGGDPFAQVDVPAMALRLKQGVGRLIRTETDRGVVAVLQHPAGQGPAALLRNAIADSLPPAARRVRTLPPLERFFAGPDPKPSARAGTERAT